MTNRSKQVLVALTSAASAAILTLHHPFGGPGASLPSAASRRRPPRHERDLAGAERGQLRFRGTRKQAGDGPSARARASRPEHRGSDLLWRDPSGAGRCARRSGRGAGQPGGGRRRSDSVQARGRREEEREPGRIGLSAIRKSSATFRVCRAPRTCPTRSRSFRARRRSSLRMNTRKRSGTYIWKIPVRRPADSWMGQSVGHWEGDTFVVEAKSFLDQTWFDRAGKLPQRRAKGH